MCGIIGCSLSKSSNYNILKQLEKLEYRGYDSCGVTDLINNQFFTFKSTNRISELMKERTTKSTLSIAHTRWATHGNVSVNNAHPIESNNLKYMIVHNGIIENYLELKEKYLTNYNFKTETDTEIIVNLFEYFSNTLNIKNTIKKLLSVLKGSFACLIVNKETNSIYFFKNKSPLLLGVGNDIILASDICALGKTVDKFYRINDFEYGIIQNEKYEIFYNDERIEPDFTLYNSQNNIIELNGFNHYMQKEIYEIKDLLLKELSKTFNKNIYYYINNSKIIILIASGTSYHSALLGSYFFNHLSNTESHAFVSCEFEYFDYYNQDDLFIVISQSGETADLIKVIDILNKNNHHILSITNSKYNTISTLSTINIDIEAGIEVAVASTKTYTLSSFILYKLACIKNNCFNYNEVLKTILELDTIYSNTNEYKNIASALFKAKNMFFLGTGYSKIIADEASLKFKEITYIHSESKSSGELKHGTISLINNGFPVLYFINEKNDYITKTSIEEVKSRGANVFIISCDDSVSQTNILINNTTSILAFIPFSVILQLISYYTALYLNNDIDKPRNLAKSVTVL